MKKILILTLTSFFLMSSLTACSKEENDEEDIDWDSEEYGQIDESEISDEDLNLSGVLYTEETKPDGSVPIVIYAFTGEDSLEIKPVQSYAMPDDITVQYLLDTICAYCIDGEVSFTGESDGTSATVDVGSISSFLTWLTYQFPDDYDYYNPQDDSNVESDVQFNAYGFLIAGLNIIDATIKSDMDISKITFTQYDGSGPLEVSESFITDGVFFDEDSIPYWLGSLDDYYGGLTTDELIEYLDESAKTLEGSELLDFINAQISAGSVITD